MSLINRETDYAIRILRALSSGELCTIPRVCEEQFIAKPFAYKISKKLEKAGLIGIKRGSNGGLFLDCDIKKTSLWDVMSAVENVQYINDCFEEGYKCECCTHKPCRTHGRLASLQNRIYDEIKNCALADII